MTNLPFLLQTTNFLSQSICTNIPSHQSPGARPNFHYLCKTDYKMKQKLTTANLGSRDSPAGREGRGRRMGAGAMSTLGRREGVLGEKTLQQAKSGGGKIRGWQSDGKSPKESLRNAQKSQRKKFRMSRGKGTIEKCLRCKKSAQNCSVERGEARRNTEITQIEWEWAQQNPAGFRDVSVREICSVNQGGLGRNPWKHLEMEGATWSSTGRGWAGKDSSTQGRHILHTCRQLPATSWLHGTIHELWTSPELGLAQICPELLQGWAQHCCKTQILDCKLQGSPAAPRHKTPALTEAGSLPGWRNSTPVWILRLIRAEELQRRAVGRGRSGHCVSAPSTHSAKEVFSLEK